MAEARVEVGLGAHLLERVEVADVHVSVHAEEALEPVVEGAAMGYDQPFVIGRLYGSCILFVRTAYCSGSMRFVHVYIVIYIYVYIYV